MSISSNKVWGIKSKAQKVFEKSEAICKKTQDRASGALVWKQICKKTKPGVQKIMLQKNLNFANQVQ